MCPDVKTDNHSTRLLCHDDGSPLNEGACVYFPTDPDQMSATHLASDFEMKHLSGCHMRSLLLSRILKVVAVVGAIGAVGFASWWSHRLQETPASQFHLRGKFGPVLNWPVIPIQVEPLPDGRLLSFGSDAQGKQGAQGIYDIWDPAKGTELQSHLTLPNRTNTDIFCSGQLLVPANDAVLIVGGDRTVNGVRNWSSAAINLFDLKSGVIKPSGRTMARPRWYPTVMTLADGDVLVLGGRLDPNHFAPVPELYSPATGAWRTLPGADKDELFGSANWNYPRAWQTPKGQLFVLSKLGQAYSVNLTGQGSYNALPIKVMRGHSYLPSLMYAPGKILSMRLGGFNYKIDLNGEQASVTSAAWGGLTRFNAMASVMADGRVYLSGGGLKNNDSSTEILADRLSQIWDPAADNWSPGAVAHEPRLYHSVAVLMSDATIFTGGGGAGYSGAKNQLNAEIYYPPYLFKKDGSGQFADRPVIASAPDFVAWGQAFDVQTTEAISKVTLIKVASATHSQVHDQRFTELPFQPDQQGHNKVTLNRSAMDMPPGYYFLFVFNKDGVPSKAKVIQVSK